LNASDPTAAAEPTPPVERTPPFESDALVGLGQNAPAVTVIPAVESTRRLLGSSFDLVGRASDDMRRASFYIGAIVVLTVAPAALGSWAIEVASVHRNGEGVARLLGEGGTAWYGLLFYLALAGLIVAAVESRTMASSLLGGHFAQRPITVRQALARSRMVFWRAIVASIIVAIPVGVAQVVLTILIGAVFGPGVDLTVPTSLVAALFGAPFAYLLTGIVLGDVNAREATRRSFRVFRARPIAACLVVIFETIALVLVTLGLSAGLDVVLRLFDALGVGVESGPAGLALITVSIVVLAFAFGTLLYTAFAISIAPQVVMFVGLTHATIGLDHVRAGGRNDPDVRRARQKRFRWLTRPVLIGTGIGVLGLAVMLTRLS
jgi:hypothetical protein